MIVKYTTKPHLQWNTTITLSMSFVYIYHSQFKGSFLPLLCLITSLPNIIHKNTTIKTNPNHIKRVNKSPSIDLLSYITIMTSYINLSHVSREYFNALTLDHSAEEDLGFLWHDWNIMWSIRWQLVFSSVSMTLTDRLTNSAVWINVYVYNLSISLLCSCSKRACALHSCQWSHAHRRELVYASFSAKPEKNSSEVWMSYTTLRPF